MEHAEPVAPSATPHLVRVRAWMAVGLSATALGLVLGAVMALRRREVVCPDGTEFPAGTTDYSCYAHPLGLQGAAVIVVCIALGALLLACGSLASHLMTAPEASTPGHGTGTGTGD